MIRRYPEEKAGNYEEMFAKPGVYAIVGAGGKTTTCFAAARALVQKGKKVVVTTTAHMMWEEDFVPESQPEAIFEKLREDGFVFTGGAVMNGKVTAISEAFLKALKKMADYVFVEADGSARLPLKAPAGHEPAVPECADYLVVVAGMNAIGHPIREICHRKEVVCELLEVTEDTPVTPEHVAEILWLGYGSQSELPAMYLLNQAEEKDEKVKKAADCLRSKTKCAVWIGRCDEGTVPKNIR